MHYCVPHGKNTSWAQGNNSWGPEPRTQVIMIISSMTTVATERETELRGATSGNSAAAAGVAGVAALSDT